MKKRLQINAFVRFIMRVSLLQIILVVAFISLANARDVSGQILEKKISIQFNRIPLRTALVKIEKETGAKFLYHTNLISYKEKVSLSVTEESLERILEILLKPLGIHYEADGSHIILSKKKNSNAQSSVTDETATFNGVPAIAIRGKVTDETETGMPGVSIILKGTILGTSTDAEGAFTLNIPDEYESNGVLIVTFIGYKALEIPIRNQTTFNIKMEPDIASLQEVVVVGYGVQKKMTSVGAQSSVKAMELKQPVANLSTAITGRLAGVIGVQRSGEPGYDNAEIYIRGISSFDREASKPLILVDGVERSFNNIDPEDIESFSILKDASATAVYGVRGANGVILINTKRGKVGKPKINIEYNQGITQFTKLPEFVDGVTYMQIANEAKKNTYPTQPAYYADEVIQATADGTDTDLYPNVNWFDELFNKTGQNRRVNFNASGGTELAKFYLSLGYYDELGLFKTDAVQQYNSEIRFKRYNFTSNVNFDLTKTTKLDFGASGWISDGNYPGTPTANIFQSAYILPPVVHPPKYSDGKIAQQRSGDIFNPYHSLTQSGYISEFKSQLWSNIRLTQGLDFLIKGLSATAMYSFDNFNQHNISRTKSVDRWRAIGRDADGNLIYEGDAPIHLGSNVLGYNRSNGGSRQFYLESAINYTATFGKHDVTGMVLYNQTDRTNAFAGNFTESIPQRFHGVAGRATYAYDERYLLETNFGYNGSEAFAPSNRYGFFPSVGIGWVISNEKFFQPANKYIQFLKLRLSHGVVGNANLSSGSGQRFAYIATVDNTNDYSFGRNQDNDFDGLDIGFYAVNVKWETSTKSNLGIEVGAFNDALSLTIDFFRDVREGIYLVRGDLPQYAGVRNAPTGNLGEVFNRGVDGTIEYNRAIGENFQVGIRGNFTWNRATVVNDANPDWPYPWQQRIGRKLGQRFGYIAEGLYASEEEIANSPRQTGRDEGYVKPGDVKFKDLNGDGVIDAQDQAPIGYGAVPEVVYGFGPMISWKGFAVGAFFKGISNVDIMLNGEGLVPFQQGVGSRGNLLTRITDRWTPENPNPNAFYPRLTDGVVNSNYLESSFWTKNGAFLRLQNVEVSYTFPKKNWQSKLGLDSFRVYFLGYNLFTHSEFKLWDVELGDGRGSNYPLIKTYSFGVDCRF